MHRQVKASDRSRVTWVHNGECICQFDITARNVLDAHAVLLYSEKNTCQPGWGSEEMFGVDGLKRFIVRNSVCTSTYRS